MFSGIWLPIVTPLRNGEVDVDALQRLADYYLRTEISGFVALSTTGEAALLDQTERLTVLHALTDVIGTRLPMLIGVGGSNTRDVLHEIQRGESHHPPNVRKNFKLPVRRSPEIPVLQPGRYVAE